MRCRKCSRRRCCSRRISSTGSMSHACERPGSWRRTTFAIRFRSAMTCSAARIGRRSLPRRSPSAAGKRGQFPFLRDAHGRPLKRNFVHVDDLVDAILAALDNPATRGKLYNIAMDEPVDYAAVAAHLKATHGLESIDIPSAYHSNWLDNTRAKLDLNWRPALRSRQAHRRRLDLQARPRRSAEGLVSRLTGDAQSSQFPVSSLRLCLIEAQH